jgi:hypothetical protein
MLQWQALFDAIPRYSLCFSHLWEFSSPATATSPAPDIVSMIQSQIGEIAITFPSTLPPACVFRFGGDTTPQHAKPAHSCQLMAVTTVPRQSAVLGAKKVHNRQMGLSISVCQRFSIQQERRPPSSR